ncbi:zn(2)-C6 transcription factor [Rhodotorula toruloides]|uniref:Zn(2)-C6 transcription factor n=1 Tax=Rhodotorula toruloides TaxID=5286 RepID=A0A511KI74_RHOTO|nr:zn(2)-C6 transcription factor [Rhodotorula toruloides]
MNSASTSSTPGPPNPSAGRGDSRGSPSLPPQYGPDGKLKTGNAYVNSFKGGIRVETANGGERTSRACLACRKLKTRCDGAEDPPCKRCRAGNHECVFVESKRGKRPSRGKQSEANLVDKFRMVEKTLATVLDSIGSGEKPDPTAISQLQASLAGGLVPDPSTGAGRRASVGSSQAMRYSLPPNEDHSPSSGSEVNDLAANTGGRKAKRARHNSSATSNGTFESPSMGGTLALSPTTTVPSMGGGGGSTKFAHLPLQGAQQGPIPSNAGRRASQGPPSNPSPGSAAPPTVPLPTSQPTPAGSSLAMLADASLAAQIDGRSQLTGLDSNFNLSTVTNAIQRQKDRLGAPVEGGTTPAVLSKGIVTPELAVELFTIFFDYAYIHLPLLDPARHTAPWVCATSPFLFTVILAVASRFHADPTLHEKIYEEAHKCFVECVSDGERSVESVQACCILTVWTYPPTGESVAAGREERPKRASLYFTMAIRMALELNLFRPASWVDRHLSKPGNSSKTNPWVTLPKDGPEAVTEQETWDALNRERTWLMVFVIDRNMATVMGRPYQILEAKPLLLPLHPQCLPFDLGVIAHVEMQTIVGQVMDTFRDRLYGLSCASDEMPSPVVMKLFNSRMDEWKARWCPMPGEPIANNLLFYQYSCKLFLNTIPLHTLLRNGDASDDPDSVSSTIASAKSLLQLGHAYAELSVLRHCPDVNFLLMLYSSVFLVKVRVSNSRFAQLVDPDELEQLLLQLMKDCQEAAQGDPRHAAMTCFVILRALGTSWKALETGGARSRGTSTRGDEEENPLAATQQQPHGPAGLGMSNGPHQQQGPLDPHADFAALNSTLASSAGGFPHVSLASAMPPSPAPMFPGHFSSAGNPFSNPFAAASNAPTPNASYRPGTVSGVQTPSAFVGNGMFEGATPAGPGIAGGPGGNSLGLGGPAGTFDGVDHFLNDSHFFGSVLVGKGASGFFDWPGVAGSLDMSTAVDPFSAGSDPFGFDSFSYNPQHNSASAAPTPALGAGQVDPMLSASPAVGSSGGRGTGAGMRNGDLSRKDDEDRKPVI